MFLEYILLIIIQTTICCLLCLKASVAHEHVSDRFYLLSAVLAMALCLCLSVCLSVCVCVCHKQTNDG